MLHVQSCCFAVLVSLQCRRILGGPNCCQHGAFASKTFARPKENVCTAGNTAGYILVDVTVFVAEAPLL